MIEKRNSTRAFTATAADGTQVYSGAEDPAAAIAAARSYAFRHKIHTRADEHNRLANGSLKPKRTVWTSWEQGGFDF